MSNKHKTSSRPKAPQSNINSQVKSAKQSFSSLADLRALYDTLKAESILARQAAAKEKNSAKQSSSGTTISQSTTNENTSIGLSQKNVSTVPQTSAYSGSPHLQRISTKQELSDDYEPVFAHYKDGSAYFCKPGVGPDVARKLSQRRLPIQAQIDLHGLRLDEARSALTEFAQDAVEEGVRCIRVIHGKGLGSANQKPALKGKVYTWLAQLREVLAFCEARPHEGGSGAVIVLLRSAKSVSRAN